MDIKTVFEFLYVAAAVVFLFGAAIFVHEFGHFWVALKRGMKVEEFAIGFGPKIFSWTRNGIVYSVRWIPAGGFVKLPQMVTSEALEGSNKGEPIPPASPLSRILVAVAGPAMNLVFGLVLATIIYFVGLPVLINPSVIGYVEPNSPESKLGIQAGDRIVSVNGSPVRTWQQVNENTVLARTNVIAVGIKRGTATNIFQLEAKASDALGGKFLNLEPEEHPTVADAQAGMAAAQAGIKTGDTLISFSGVPLFGRDQLIKLVQKRAGQPTELVVERGSSKEKISVMVEPKMDPGTKTYRIGIVFGNENRYEVQKPGPAVSEQFRTDFNRIVGVFSALIHSKQTGVGLKDLSGPPGIFAMLAVAVKTDYRLALDFLVFLNINLAMLNLLPLPVLDGGHILMALIEGIFRRKLPVRVQEYATTAFALVLISLMVYISYHDIGRIPLFRTLLKQETQIEKAPPVPANTN
jgi:regulator of sigma E protease